MKPNRIAVFSPFPPEECAERIRAAIDADWRSTGFFGHKCVVGNVSESSLRLYRRGGRSGAFEPCLIGKMRPVPGGTIISGRFAVHPHVHGFMLLWFTVSIVGGGPTALENARALLSGDGGGDPVLVIGLPLTLLCGIGFVLAGVYAARDEAATIRAFIIKAVQGRETGQGT